MIDCVNEYISRNEAMKIIGNARFPEEEWDTENNASYALKLVRDYIPTADVAPVIHAKWIFVNDRCGCSNCRLCLSYDGNGVIIDMSHLPYCPHCGARMDLED